jgi:nucleoid-associated protein YgaU
MMIAPALVVTAIGAAAAAGLWWSDEPEAAMVVRHAAAAPVANETVCRRVHVFRDGETLETIAEKELGASWRWQEIAVLNRDRLDQALQDGLRPGTPLDVPTPCVH